MTIKVTVPNTSSDSLTFGSANTPTAAQVVGIDSGSSNGQLAFNTTASGTSTERVRITQAGNVGVGTTTPTNISGYTSIALDNATNGSIVDLRAGGTLQSRWVATSSQSAISTETATPLVFQTNASERARIDSSGNFLFGATSTTAPSLNYRPSSDGGYFTKNANTTGATTAYDFLINGTRVGAITTAGSNTTYSTSSDYRLKENIAPMTGALSVIQQLQPVTYNWKVDGVEGQGFIAHELQEVVPECVVGEKDAVEIYLDEEGNEHTRPQYQGIDTSFLVATLTAAIQEQQALITTLTERIIALEAK